MPPAPAVVAPLRVDAMLTRNARLALRLQQLAALYHQLANHLGRLAFCPHPVCLKTLAVVNENAQP